jgi:hypothetical protein
LKNIAFIFFVTLSSQNLWAQKILVTPADFFRSLQAGAIIPEKILSGRTAVLYDQSIKPEELKDIHSSFQRTGIDAVAYLRLEKAIGGFDTRKEFTEYFTTRTIDILIVLTHAAQYQIFITPFAPNAFANHLPMPCWSASHEKLSELLRQVYRTAASTYKKKNLLINDVPETNFTINIINQVRNETFAYDLKVDALAVPKFNDEKLDAELEEIFKNYPLKYKLVDPAIDEAELRKQGFLYVLRFVNAPCLQAKELCEYEISGPVSAFVSVTYPNGQPVLKTISAETPVFKFYAKKIDSENVFLGNKWDADTTWQEALRNYIKGLRIEFKLN